MGNEAPELLLSLLVDDAVELSIVLSRLAALMDLDDPDVLPAEASELAAAQLTSTQILLLNPIAKYRDVERAGVARNLRRISASITGQLPLST